MFERSCPSCGKTIKYKNKYHAKYAEQEKRICKSCTWTDERKIKAAEICSKTHKGKDMSGEKNPFYGKKQSSETKQRLSKVDRSYTKTTEFSNSVKAGMIGKDCSVDLKAKWFAEGGQEEVERRELERRRKISEAMSGEKNPMFGKPAPTDSGNGWCGHYRGWFFRSLLELSFATHMDLLGIEWKSGESKEYAIQWIDERGNQRTYFPDFVLDRKIVECKPTFMHRADSVVRKCEAVNLWCEIRGWTFEMIDPEILGLNRLQGLIESGQILLSTRTSERWRKFNDQRK